MVAVVIPSYKVKKHIAEVIASIGPEVAVIYVVDDACPEGSGRYVEEQCKDPRLRVLYNQKNLGVGGAVMEGYKKAVAEGADIMVKLDGDGQMDARLIPALIKPILQYKADYVKGNRFFDPSYLHKMPLMRVIGNSFLSLINKFVTGYWNIMDPTNGFTAIHRSAIEILPLHKIEKRYFFESDMLFRLGTVHAVVQDMPMKAVYGDEKSSLRIARVLFEFPPKYFVRLFKRIGYRYFLRDFNIGTLELGVGLLLSGIGGYYGIHYWHTNAVRGVITPTGTVMLASLPVIFGFQFLLSFLHFDIANVPKKPLCELLEDNPVI